MKEGSLLTLRPRSVQMFLAGFGIVVLAVSSLSPRIEYADFIEDYVSARAILFGDNPYAPLDDLIHRYVPAGIARFGHVNAHPPVLVLTSLPLARLPYEVAAQLWLAISIALLYFIGRALKLSVWGSLAFASWPPIWGAIALGGSEMLLLGLIVAGCASARQGRDWRAGSPIGAAAALKLYPILCFMPFIVQRRVKVITGGVVVLALGQAINIAIVGPAGLVDYYVRQLPAFDQMFAASIVNQSPHGALLRIFGGASDLAPLISAPAIVLPLTVLISPLGLFALGRLRPEAGSLAMLVILPSVWSNYVALALPQIVYLWRSRRRRHAFVVCAVAASWLLGFALPLPLFAGLVESLGRHAREALIVLGAIQPLGLIGLVVLSWLEERDRFVDTAVGPVASGSSRI